MSSAVVSGSCGVDNAVDTVDVDNLIVKDLRKELKKRGLGTGGRKAELQKRLREYFAAVAAAKDKVNETECVEQKVDVITKTADGEKTFGLTKVESAYVKSIIKGEIWKPKAESATLDTSNTDGETFKEADDWRIQAEERRKAALEIRARKKMKVEIDAGDAKKPPVVTPVANPYSSSKKVTNPYAKKSSASTSPAATMPNPATKKEDPPAAAAMPKSSAPSYKPKPVAQALPLATSMWGDCRLDLWEATCRCGGERKAPDLRMCRCAAWADVGRVA